MKVIDLQKYKQVKHDKEISSFNKKFEETEENQRAVRVSNNLRRMNKLLAELREMDK